MFSELLLSKRILADIIPLGNLPSTVADERYPRAYDNCHFEEDIDIIINYDSQEKSEEMLGSNIMTSNLSFEEKSTMNKHINKINNKKKLHYKQECTQEPLQVDLIKERLLIEVDKHLTLKNKSWPLDEFGIKLLQGRKEIVCDILKPIKIDER